MVIIRECLTGRALGIFDNYEEIENEYHFTSPGYSLKKRLQDVARNKMRYSVFKIDDELLIALYIDENEAIEKDLLIC